MLPAGYLRVCCQTIIGTWIRGNPAPIWIRTRGSNYLQVTCKDLDPRPALHSRNTSVRRKSDSMCTQMISLLAWAKEVIQACGTLLKEEQLLWRQTVVSGLCSRITHVLQQAMSVQRTRSGTKKERKNAHRASSASWVYWTSTWSPHHPTALGACVSRETLTGQASSH